MLLLKYHAILVLSAIPCNTLLPCNIIERVQYHALQYHATTHAHWDTRCCPCCCHSMQYYAILCPVIACNTCSLCTPKSCNSMLCNTMHHFFSVQYHTRQYLAIPRTLDLFAAAIRGNISVQCTIPCLTIPCNTRYAHWHTRCCLCCHLMQYLFSMRCPII